LIEKPCRIIYRMKQNQIDDRVLGSYQKGPETIPGLEFYFL